MDAVPGGTTSYHSTGQVFSSSSSSSLPSGAKGPGESNPHPEGTRLTRLLSCLGAVTQDNLA